MWINKERKRRFSFLLISVMVMTAGVNVSAASADGITVNGNVLTKKILFSTDDKSESKEDSFPETIEEDGKTYRLKKVEYDILSEEPARVEKEVEKVIDSAPIPEGESYEAPETLQENGVTYVLDRVEKQDVTEDQMQEVAAYTDYDHAITNSDVPQTKEVTVKNQQTGEDMSVTCSLTGVSRLSQTSWEDSYIDITFESYDAKIFRWNDVIINKNSDAPLAGYETQLLSSVGADSSNCRVNRTYWAGEAYVRSDGVLCRDARADIQRRVYYYRADYKTTVTLGTVYKAYYKGTETVTDEDNIIYSVQATGTYGLVSNMPYILAGVGIILLLILIVLILFLAARKRKRGNQEG